MVIMMLMMLMMMIHVRNHCSQEVAILQTAKIAKLARPTSQNTSVPSVQQFCVGASSTCLEMHFVSHSRHSRDFSLSNGIV